MSKIVNYLVAAAVSLTSVASIAAQHTCGNLSGVYLGGSFGYGIGNGTYNSNLNVGKTSVFSASNDAAVKGARGGLHLGYGKLFPNKTYLGFETSADYSNTTGKNKVTVLSATGSAQAKRRDSYGIALRMGGVLGAGMLTYAKVGVDTAKWKTNADIRVPSYNRHYYGSNTKRSTGLVLGLGMGTMVSEHVMVEGEYAYTSYKNVTNLNVSNNTGTGTNSYKPRVSDFRLRVSYKW